jgi:hypothetical protein
MLESPQQILTLKLEKQDAEYTANRQITAIIEVEGKRMR